MLAALLGGLIAATSPSATLFTGGTIIPVTAQDIPDGHLFVQDGRIVSIGPAGAFKPPTGIEYKTVDLAGGMLMPDSSARTATSGGGAEAMALRPSNPRRAFSMPSMCRTPAFAARSRAA